MVDSFTKMAEVGAWPDVFADTVSQAIFNGWICRWGAPDQIHSDKGSSFENTIIRDLSNGQVERINRTLIGLLRVFVDRLDPLTWDDVLPACMLDYRPTVHALTHQTPVAFTRGLEMRILEDLQASQRRQKDHYDQLAHGSPYEVGDVESLRNHSVVQGMPSNSPNLIAA
ncbi:unnamed protein product [Dibothriocephalus latus]|uniref:Integrase catalytic domain-containing protein n=1 Tax=Dibothriocephalus latus TaxID=60516 RepID=A0A3P7LQU2_DIBLA|nr:unnamed protein product [Dibothriocephalus latus]